MSEQVGPTTSLEREGHRVLSKTFAEIEWLLLMLVLLYQTFGGTRDEGSSAVAMALFFYAAFILSFRYDRLYQMELRRKMALKTVVMIVFITWSLWFTGKVESPLLNTYLLAIISSALALGKIMTLVELAVIALCFLFLGDHSSIKDLYSLRYVGGMAAQFAPFVLVAYITTTFSADIRYGLNKAKVISETDELTGLLNRRGFAVVATRMHGQSVRHNRDLSVLMIDSDNLKPVNDNYGHHAGDRLLIHLVQTIQSQVRFTDVFARQGGDEFIIMLPETPASGALHVAEKIRKAVAMSPLVVDGKNIGVTVSIGVASYPDEGRTLEALLANADAAMYAAKTAGRDQVVKFAA